MVSRRPIRTDRWFITYRYYRSWSSHTRRVLTGQPELSSLPALLGKCRSNAVSGSFIILYSAHAAMQPPLPIFATVNYIVPFVNIIVIKFILLLLLLSAGNIQYILMFLPSFTRLTVPNLLYFSRTTDLSLH